MKHGTRYAAYCTACLLTAALPLQVLAAPTDSPEFARTSEEWARLQDNYLEYNEIPDLIHEYNSTVLNNRASYLDYLGKDKDDIAQRYRDTAKELRENIEYPTDPTDTSYASMLMAAQMNETQAKNLEQQADDNVDDSQVISMQYQMVEDNLVLTTKLNLIAYYQKLLENQMTERNKEFLTVKYEVVQNQAAAGTVIQLEVINARQAIEQLESKSLSDARETVTLKQKICLATGWNYDADPVFGLLPELDFSQVADIDLDSDIAKAMESNYTLRINQRKYDNSTSSTVKNTLEETIKENRQKISSDVITKYNTLMSALTSYDLAVTEQTVQAKTLNSAEIKFRAGMLSRLDYEQEGYTKAEKDYAVENAGMALYSAWETYQGVVNGLASAS